MFFDSSSSISDFISYDLTFPSLGSKQVQLGSSSATFSYPCTSYSVCTPYTINISKGIYKFECWGSKGISWTASNSGLGGYTSGIIHIHSPTTFYIYIGAMGMFNCAEREFLGSYKGGGATDVRLEQSENWYSFESLKSRIMVAGGGGGSEWSYSVGGNGGGLSGGPSQSSKGTSGPEIYPESCQGASQTSGGSCPTYSTQIVGYSGTFGISGSPMSSSDMGGYGGGGYYGGGSTDFSGGGSGGSSFISGYKGCNSIGNFSYIMHTNSPFHFSGFSFQEGIIIPGKTTMPLPNGNEGIWNEAHGKFRITFIGYCTNLTCQCSNTTRIFLFTLAIIISS